MNRDLQNIIQLIEQGTKSIDLQYKTFGSDSFKELASKISKCTSIEELDLTGCRIGSKNVKILSDALESNRSLTSLYLRRNRIDASGCVKLAKSLKISDSIKTLDLSFNEICDDDDDEGVGLEALAELLQNNLSLEDLNLSHCKIKRGDFDSLYVFLQALIHNISVATLKLDDNSLDDSDAEQIAEVLSRNHSLLNLSLRKNNIGLGGWTFIGEALQTNTTILYLDLIENRIGDDGCKALSLSLCGSSSSLEVLKLAENEIGSTGIIALSEALCTNSHLRVLDLSYNPIGDEGGHALAEALVSNNTLKSLTLIEIETQDMMDEVFAAALSRCNPNTLQELRLFEGDESFTAAQQKIQEKLLEAVQDEQKFTRVGLTALENDRPIRWGKTKLMVVGKAGAGKTSTVRSLLKQDYDPNHNTTIGAELKVTRTNSWLESEPCSRSTDLGDIIRNIQSRQSGRIISSLSRRTSSRRSSSRPASARLADPPFIKEELAKVFDPCVRRRSQENKKNISFTIWDYGGQDVFHTLHHLFLTEGGVYLLVFDLREIIGRELFSRSTDYNKLESRASALSAIRFWLESITLHTNSAKFVLVGTFLDQVPEEDQIELLEEVDACIRPLLRIRNANLEFRVNRRQASSGWCFFPLDNTKRENEDESGVLKLRKSLESSAKEEAGKKLPIRWAACLNNMIVARKDYMSYEDISRLAKEKFSIPDEDIPKMLSTMHNLGGIIYLNSTPQLKEVVVLRPQWLLDNISLVICDEGHMDTHRRRIEAESEVFSTDILSDHEKWRDEGIASHRLLLHLWKYPSLVNYFSALMEEMFLASPSPWNDDMEGSLLIPSLLKPLNTDTVSLPSGNLSFAFIDLEYFPDGVFQRFIVSMILTFPELIKIEHIYADAALVQFGRANLILFARSDDHTIELRFPGQSAECLGSLISLLYQQLRYIDNTFMKGNMKPKLFVSCNESRNGDYSVAFSELLRHRNMPTILSGSKKTLQVADFKHFLAHPSQIETSQSEETCSTAVEFGEGLAQVIADGEKRYDVFLSHSWGEAKSTHEFVCMVKKILEEKYKLKCWLDEAEIHSGDVKAAMAYGIDCSKASIVFVTEDYFRKVNLCSKENCYLEFGYIARTQSHERMVPAILEKSLLDTSKWLGTFGIAWGHDPLFVDMTSGGSAQEIENLVEMVTKILIKE